MNPPSGDPGQKLNRMIKGGLYHFICCPNHFQASERRWPLPSTFQHLEQGQVRILVIQAGGWKVFVLNGADVLTRNSHSQVLHCALGNLTIKYSEQVHNPKHKDHRHIIASCINYIAEWVNSPAFFVLHTLSQTPQPHIQMKQGLGSYYSKVMFKTCFTLRP